MCGRYSLNPGPRDFKEHFGLTKIFSLEPRFNIAPSQDVAAIRLEEGERHLVMLHWGLIPFWAEDPKIAFSTINARSETASKAPAFRAAFRSRRCLIPASGFYEWDKKGDTKQPYYIHRADEHPIAFAGLWEHWEDKEGKGTIESCTILTTLASDPVKKIHERMPVVLEPEDFSLWLNPDEHKAVVLRDMLKPIAAGALSMYPVSTYVNKARNEGEKCLEPLSVSS